MDSIERGGAAGKNELLLESSGLRADDRRRATPGIISRSRCKDESEIYVDDMVTPKITWTDSTHRRGQIGVRAFQSNAQFDNVTFTNAAPLRLDLQRAGNLLQFTWQQNANNLQLARPRTSLRQPVGLLSPTPPLFPTVNGISPAIAAQPSQFYRLQPK